MYKITQFINGYIGEFNTVLVNREGKHYANRFSINVTRILFKRNEQNNLILYGVKRHN